MSMNESVNFDRDIITVGPRWKHFYVVNFLIKTILFASEKLENSCTAILICIVALYHQIYDINCLWGDQNEMVYKDPADRWPTFVNEHT